MSDLLWQKIFRTVIYFRILNADLENLNWFISRPTRGHLHYGLQKRWPNILFLILSFQSIQCIQFIYQFHHLKFGNIFNVPQFYHIISHIHLFFNIKFYIFPLKCIMLWCWYWSICRSETFNNIWIESITQSHHVPWFYPNGCL